MPYDPSAFIHFAMQNGVFPEGGKYGDRITFTIHAPNNLMLVLDAGRNTGVLPPSLEFDKRNGKITKVCNGFDKYPEMLKWLIVCYVTQRVTRMTGLKVIKMICANAHRCKVQPSPTITTLPPRNSTRWVAASALAFVTGSRAWGRTCLRYQ